MSPQLKNRLTRPEPRLGLHLLDLVQVTVDVVSRDGGIQTVSVLLYLFFYEVSYILVDALQRLVWPRQTPHQPGKGVVKLWSEAGRTGDAFTQS